MHRCIDAQMHACIDAYDAYNAYVYMYTYGTSKSDLSILAALKLQEFEGSIFSSRPAVVQIIINI